VRNYDVKLYTHSEKSIWGYLFHINFAKWVLVASRRDASIGSMRTFPITDFASRRDASIRLLDASLRDAKSTIGGYHLATYRCISTRCSMIVKFTNLSKPFMTYRSELN